MQETAKVMLPLFVYGSLRDPAVRARVLGERAGVPAITMRAGVLHGYRWQIVDSFDYPFVLPATDGDEVPGQLLCGLNAQDYMLLDQYEDLEDGRYERVQVTVATADGPAEAWLYRKGPRAPSS